MSKEIRNSNFELIRIIAMISIIALHAFRHAPGDGLLIRELSINHLILQLTCSWGIVGTDIFIILSAYFLLKSNKVKPQKLICLATMVSLYSFLAYITSVLYSLLKGEKMIFLIKEIIKAFLSPITGQYWFITGYIILYLIHPLMNEIIDKVSEKTLKYLAITSFTIVFVYKYIYMTAPVSIIGIFISIYFLTSIYIRKYQAPKIEIRIFGAIAFISILILEIVVSLLPEQMRHIMILRYVIVQTIGKNSPFMLIIAFALFDFIRYQKPFYSKSINFISGSTIAVYIIHESDYILPFLWGDVFPVAQMYTSSFFPLKLLLIICAVFLICIGIDIVLRPIYTTAAKYINKVLNL